MSLLISVLVLLVIAYVIYLALKWILGIVSLPEPVVAIVWIIFAAIVLFKLLALLGYSNLAIR